jgi:DNA repair exonuclease SbcCD nuclease subunit
VKLLHAADLHIDSPLRGLSAYEGAPVDEIRNAVRRAVANLVDLAVDEDVKLLLLAGDIYDGAWKDYRTGLFFTKQMQRLAEAGVQVCLVSGNHDAESRITRELRLPDNVHRFTTAQAESKAYEDLGVAVHGQGFAERDVKENLARNYPAPYGGMVNIGLLHTALTGSPEHDTYAPCTVADLTSKGYDYWALGHIHAREVVGDDPWIVFPGNLQGRHARETGPKGATLITVDGGRITAAEHRDLDVVRWAHLHIDAAKAPDADTVLTGVQEQLRTARDQADGRLLAARVSVEGPSDAHEELWRDRERFTNEVRALADSGLWVEKVRIATRHAETTEALPELVTDLTRTAATLRADPGALEKLITALPGLRALDHQNTADAGEALAFRDEGRRTEIFDEAVDLLAALVAGEEPT